MDLFQKIVKWNEERNLLSKPFNHEKEVSFIVEELLESTGSYNSETARDYAAEIVTETNPTKEEIVDAFADIIVFATGAITKCGYSPSQVMDEVYTEINSRTGKIVEGKFVKDTDVVPYKADFSKCLLENKN